jgi:hypothetical protein
MSDVFAFSAGVGQRSDAFEFERREGASGRPLGLLHPIRAATLAANGGKSITRALAFDLGEDDSAAVDFESERVHVSMIAAGQRWPLGRYLFTDYVQQDYADPDTDAPRSLTACQLGDAMTMVDTELESGFTCDDEAPRAAVERLLGPFGFTMIIEDSPHLISNSWMAGTSRKQVLEAIAELGGYLAPWFDHDGVFRMVRLFDPAEGEADMDFDAARSVFADSVTRAGDSPTRPNRVIVVSNSAAATGGNGAALDPGPLMAFCDVPSTAPHSIQRLGFVRPKVFEMQVDSLAQAQNVADLLCLTQTVAETLTCATAIDPRHDAWQTVQFQGQRWLEYGWSMELVAGGDQQHQLQRSYLATPEILSGVAGQIIAAGG